jgi:hypothetical protein
LDLLGVDEDGRLVVFELKRGELTRLAVAQVLDYASSLNGLETSDLSDRITEMSGRGGTEKLESFATWYEENYNEALADIGRPRMVLVGLGVDAAAKRIVEFLTQANLDISLITFYGFRQNGETFLARQVEVEARGPAQVARASKAENQAKLRQRLQETGLEGIYGALQTTLERALGDEVSVWPNAGGHTYYYPERTESGGATIRAYVGISVPDNLRKVRKVQITLQPRAAATIDRDLLSRVAKRLGSEVTFKPSGYAEIVIDTKRPMQEFEDGLSDLGKEIQRIWETRKASLEGSIGAEQ